MRTLLWITSVTSALMLLSTLICGLWIRSHGADQSSKAFHANLGISTTIVSLIMVVLTIMYLMKK